MPESPSLVIANTTPIIALALIGHLDILRQLYNEIVIPPAVQEEVQAGGSRGVGVTELQQADWIRTVPLRDSSRAALLVDLDRGEAEVIALAQELNATLVIIDERLARRHASRLGLRLTGTLGVLLRAKEQRLVPSVKPLIEGLQRGGIRLGEAVISETLKLAGEKQTV